MQVFVDLAHASQTEQANAFNSHLYNEHTNVLQTEVKRLLWLVATSEAWM